MFLFEPSAFSTALFQIKEAKIPELVFIMHIT